MSSVLGLDCKAYRNTGTYGSPTWNEIPNIRDLTIPMEKTKADVSSRASKYRMSRGTLRDINISFSMVWDTADADFTALRDAWLNDTSIDMVFLDGSSATVGSQGPRAYFEVTKFERTENLEETAMVNVEICPTHNLTNPPTWYTVT